MEAQSVNHCDKRQHIENAIQQAQYEAARARRQYDAVDLDNRLVASELERRWNEKLVQLRDVEVQLETLKQTQHAPALSAADRARLMILGKDLTKAWNSPGASIEARKKIIRLLVKEIIVDVVGNTLALLIHWQGGDHTQLTVKKEQDRTNPLDGRSRCPRSRSRIGEAIIGHGNRCDSQSIRQVDCTWCELDTIPRLQPSERQRHSCLSRR
ncbi:transposase [Bradyrhizobium sp. 25ACV]